jgi:hypothetical protein
LLIGASPVGLLAGTYTFGFFGWFVSVNTLLTVFLQEPTEDGGYGFTPQQNAGCKELSPYPRSTEPISSYLCQQSPSLYGWV